VAGWQLIACLLRARSSTSFLCFCRLKKTVSLGRLAAATRHAGIRCKKAVSRPAAHLRPPQGPFDSSVCLLTHPLEEPHPVIADCLLQQHADPRPAVSGGWVPCGGGFGGAMGEGVALSGWTNESVVWTSEQLPFVATYNDVSTAGS
jgi:hypothetical protein